MKTTMIAGAVTALALVGGSAARAQSPAAPATAPATAPAAAPAAAPVDPAALKASQELFEAMNYRVMMGNMMTQMSQSMGQSMRSAAQAAVNNNPQLTAEQRTAALAKMETQLPAAISAMQSVISDPGLIDEILAETVPLYARTFTADEIKQITAFYRTPVGAKMLASMPQLMSQGMQMGQQVVMRRIGPLMQKMQQAQKEQQQQPSKQ